jgi:HSP20 family protein
MRQEVLEETIRYELEQQAEKFGVNYSELSPNVRSWLRSLVIEQLYEKDALVVKAEVPGLLKDEIDVSVTGNILTIKGEKTQSHHKLEPASKPVLLKEDLCCMPAARRRMQLHLR